MHSSTSNSELRFLIALGITFATLVATWEWVLRRHASATIDVVMNKPAITATSKQSDEWILFGNCLVMTGLSPKQLNTDLGGSGDREIVNIAWHEQSPLAFFEYLRKADHFPHVVIANISSWLNGTNFEQEAKLVEVRDPLNVGVPTGDARAQHDNEYGAYRSNESVAETFQKSTEAELSGWADKHWMGLGHRYHLFDYSLFIGTLFTGRSLDDALYQLNMQSWFRVRSSEGDGLGWLGIDVEYRADWPHGLDRMAERSLQRLRLTRLLNETYWKKLEEETADFTRHGTRVVLLRMPEHPKIRAFNDEAYDLTNRLNGIAARTGAYVVDLSDLGPSNDVRLFDAVHPDKPSAAIITRELAERLRSAGIGG